MPTQASKTRSANSSRAQSRSPRDYVSVAVAYAEEAVEDRAGARFGRRLRQGARRFLDDLKRAQLKNPPFNWSPEQANAACRFIDIVRAMEVVDWRSLTGTSESR